MEITQKEREKLISFLGYGNLNAPFWFLGMEEGTSGENNIEPNVMARLKFADKIMDLQEVHVHLEWEYWDHSKRVRFPSVWIYMARFVRALDTEKAEDWWDTEKAKAFIRTDLGRKRESGKTFLTELLPLPKPHANKWNEFYANIMGFKDMEDYREAIIPTRKQIIKQIMVTSVPRYLLCYGETNFNHYKDLMDIQDKEWEKITQTKFECATSGKTRIILSPFMGNGRVGHKSFNKLIEYLRNSESK